MNNGSLALSSSQHRTTTERKMAQKRTWDESRSPQWRYLLSKDSQEKREREKKEERMDQAEGELKRGVSKRKRRAQERHQENRKLKSKSGREIVYSAHGGVEHARSINSVDVTGARANHGDRATADALLSMAMGIRGIRQMTVVNTPLPGSLIWRRKQSEQHARKAVNRWL